MNRDQLGYFLLVYRTGSFSAAAAQVPMSTQGMGKAIRSLEAELGVPLFDVDENGTRTPTAYGEAFRSYVEQLEREHSRLLAEFDRIRRSSTQTIHMCSALGIAGFVGTECLRSFSLAHPDIGVVSSEFQDYDCDAALIEGRVDLGFTLAPFDEALVSIPLFAERFFFWVNTDNPLSKRESLTVQDLEGENLAIFGSGVKCHATFTKLLEDSGVEPKSIATSQEVFWHYQEALQGKGLGMTVEHLTKEAMFCHSADVVAVPFDGMNWTIGLSYARNHTLAEYEHLFLDHALAFFKTCP